MLRTRLRGAKPTAYPHYRMVLLTNPGVPTHHLRTAEGLRMAYSTHQDNPALWDGTTWTSEGERYLAELRNLTGVQRQRLLDARWVAAEGIIWPDFDPAVDRQSVVQGTRVSVRVVRRGPRVSQKK